MRQSPSVRQMPPNLGVLGTEVRLHEARIQFEKETIMQGRDWVYLSGLFLGYIGVVVGSYYWSYLLPAWEADPSLGWTMSATAMASTLASISETSGLWFLGPLPDLVNAKNLIYFHLAFASVLMSMVSIANIPWVIITLIVLILLSKSMMWAAFGVLVARNLPKHHADSSYTIIGLASRSGDIVTSLVVSMLLQHVTGSWRHAVLLLAFLIICLATVFSLVTSNGTTKSQLSVSPVARRNRSSSDLTTQSGYGSAEISSDSEFEEDDELLAGSERIRPGSTRSSMTGYIRHWDNAFRHLFTDLDCWLGILQLGCTYVSWAYFQYMGILMAARYDLTQAMAARSMMYFAIGTLLALLGNILVVWSVGTTPSRVFSVLASVAGAVGFTVLACTTADTLPYHACCWINILVGFGNSIPFYIPFSVYCSASDRNDVGFLMAMSDGCGGLMGVIFVAIVGQYRLSHSPEEAWFLTTSVGAVACCVCTISLTWFFLNLQKHESREA